MFTKNNFKQRISILEDGAGGEQVDDIEKIIVKNLFKIFIALHEIDESSIFFLLWPQVCNEFKECEKKEFKFKIFKVMKLTFKIIFSQFLLRITFDDRFWRSHIDILYLST